MGTLNVPQAEAAVIKSIDTQHFLYAIACAACRHTSSQRSPEKGGKQTNTDE